MLRKIPRAAALVGAIALGLTACGDVSDPGSTPAPTSSTPDATTPSDGSADQTSSTDATSSGSETSEDDMQSPSPIPRPTGGAALPTGPVPDAVVQRPDVQEAIADYAKRMQVDVDQVEVAGFAEVTWSDGSLGCPQPGMMYTQALVPGYQLVLSVDGQLGSYHSAKDKPFDYCASPVAPAQGGSTSR